MATDGKYYLLFVAAMQKRRRAAPLRAIGAPLFVRCLPPLANAGEPLPDCETVSQGWRLTSKATVTTSHRTNKANGFFAGSRTLDRIPLRRITMAPSRALFRKINKGGRRREMCNALEHRSHGAESMPASAPFENAALRRPNEKNRSFGAPFSL